MGAAEEALLQRLSAAFCGDSIDGNVCNGDVERARNVLLLASDGLARSSTRARKASCLLQSATTGENHFSLSKPDQIFTENQLVKYQIHRDFAECLSKGISPSAWQIHVATGGRISINRIVQQEATGVHHSRQHTCGPHMRVAARALKRRLMRQQHNREVRGRMIGAADSFADELTRYFEACTMPSTLSTSQIVPAAVHLLGQLSVSQASWPQDDSPATIAALLSAKRRALAPKVVSMREAFVNGVILPRSRATLMKKPRTQSKAKLSRRDTRQMQKRLQRVCARRVAHAALGLRKLVLVPARDLSGQRHLAMAQSVMDWHSKTAHIFELQRAKEAEERLEHLKSHNIEEYLKLVQKNKTSRVRQMLAQTDDCLRKLAVGLKSACSLKSICIAKESVFIQSGDEDLDAFKESTGTWNTLSQNLRANIAEQPRLLENGRMHEYQMHGLRWLVGLHDVGLNGILADEMGLGKTIQVISLIAYLIGERAMPGPFLLIMPSSLISNWENEFKKWAPSVRLYSHKGAAQTRLAALSREMRGRTPKFHVLLTTYEVVMGREDRPCLCKVKWTYIIVDEGHRLKNAGCKLATELKHFRADNRLLITGTPLQNDLRELWALLSFLMPTRFESANDFQRWFGTTSDGEAPLDAEESLLVTTRLHQVLRPFMLRRLKESVVKELPPKVVHDIKVAPSPYQKALCGLMEEELKAGSAAVGVKGINNAVMELRNIANHPLISRLHQSGSEQDLPKHPLPPEVRLCAKMEILDSILLKLHASGHKVLLFSTMTRALDVIEDYLEWRSLSFLRLDGDTSSAERGELVAEFNDPASDTFIFLLSMRAGGVGLNLQAADTVIIYDTDWNPQVELQAHARAHRIGQKREVLVLRLLTAGTVEERINAAAESKRSFADASITGGFFDGRTTADDRRKYLLDLLQKSSSANSEASCLSAHELNEMLARSEEELALFKDKDAWIASTENDQYKGVAPYLRLATADDVRMLVEEARAAVQPKSVEDPADLGRGKRGGRAKQPKLGCGLPGQDGAEHSAPVVPASGKALAPLVSTLSQHENQEMRDHLAVMLDNELALPGGQSIDGVPAPVPQAQSLDLPCADVQPGSANDVLAPSSGITNRCLNVEVPPLMDNPLLNGSLETLGNAPCLHRPLPAQHNSQERNSTGQKEGPSCAAVRGKPPATPVKGNEATPHKESVKVVEQSTQGSGKDLVPDQGFEGPNPLGHNHEWSELQLLSSAPYRSPRELPVFDAPPVGTADDLTSGHPEQLIAGEINGQMNGDQPGNAANTMDIVSLVGLGGIQQPSPSQPVEDQLAFTSPMCIQMPSTVLSCSPADGMRAEKYSGLQLEKVVSPDIAVAAVNHGQGPPATPDLGSTVSPAAFAVAGSDGASMKPHNGREMPSPGHAALRDLGPACSAIHPLDVSVTNMPAEGVEAGQSLEISGEGETLAIATAESLLLLAGGSPANQSALGDFQPLDLDMSNTPGGEDEAAQSLVLLQTIGGREEAMVAGAESLLFLAEGADVPVDSLLALATIASDPGPCQIFNTDKGLNARGGRPIQAIRARTMQKRRAAAALAPLPMSSLRVPVQLLVDKRRCQPPGNACGLSMLASSARGNVQARRRGEGENMDVLASPKPAGQAAGQKRKRRRGKERSNGSQPSDHIVQAPSASPKPAGQPAGKKRKRPRGKEVSNGSQPSEHIVQAPSAPPKPAAQPAGKKRKRPRGKEQSNGSQRAAHIVQAPSASPKPAAQTAGKSRKRPRQKEGSNGSQPSDYIVQAPSSSPKPAPQPAGKMRNPPRQKEGSKSSRPSDHIVTAPSGGTNPLLSGHIVTSKSGGNNPLCASLDDQGHTNDESTIPGATVQKASGITVSRLCGQPAKRQKRLSQHACPTQCTASSPKNSPMAKAGGMVADRLSLPLDDDMGFVVHLEVETPQEELGPEDSKGLPCHSLAGEPIAVPVDMEPPEGGVVVPLSTEAGIARSNDAPAKQTFPKHAVTDKAGCKELLSSHPLFALRAPQSVSCSRPFPYKPRSALQVSRGALFARRSVPVAQSEAVKGLQIQNPPRAHIPQDSPALTSLTGVKLIEETSNHHSKVQLNVSRVASALEGQQAACSAADGLQCGGGMLSHCEMDSGGAMEIVVKGVPDDTHQGGQSPDRNSHAGAVARGKGSEVMHIAASVSPGRGPAGLLSVRDEVKPMPEGSIAFWEVPCHVLPSANLALGPTGRSVVHFGGGEQPALPKHDSGSHTEVPLETTLAVSYATAEVQRNIHDPAKDSTTMPAPSPGVSLPKSPAQVPLSRAAASHLVSGSPSRSQLDNATQPFSDSQQQASHLLGLIDLGINGGEPVRHGNVSSDVENPPSVQVALSIGNPLPGPPLSVAGHSPVARAVEEDGQAQLAFEQSGPAAQRWTAEQAAHSEYATAGGDVLARPCAATSPRCLQHPAGALKGKIGHSELDLLEVVFRGYSDKPDGYADHTSGEPAGPPAAQKESEDSDSSLPSLSLDGLLGEMNREFDEILGPDIKDLLSPAVRGGQPRSTGSQVGPATRPSTLSPVSTSAQDLQNHMRPMRCHSKGEAPAGMPWVPQDLPGTLPHYLDSCARTGEAGGEGLQPTGAIGASEGDLLPVSRLEVAHSSTPVSQKPDTLKTSCSKGATAKNLGLPPLPPLPSKRSAAVAAVSNCSEPLSPVSWMIQQAVCSVFSPMSLKHTPFRQLLDTEPTTRPVDLAITPAFAGASSSLAGSGEQQATQQVKRPCTEALPPRPAEAQPLHVTPLVSAQLPSREEQQGPTCCPVQRQAGPVGTSVHARSSHITPLKEPKEAALLCVSAKGVAADWSAFLFGEFSDFGTEENVHDAALKFKSLSEAEP